MKIRSVHLPFFPFEEIDPADRDVSKRENFVRTQTKILQAAAAAGIGIAVVHPSAEPYSNAEREERLGYAIESLRALQKAAAVCGMRLAIENLPRTCMGRDIKEMVRILNAVEETGYTGTWNYEVVNAGRRPAKVFTENAKTLEKTLF